MVETIFKTIIPLADLYILSLHQQISSVDIHLSLKSQFANGRDSEDKMQKSGDDGMSEHWGEFGLGDAWRTGYIPLQMTTDAPKE